MPKHYKRKVYLETDACDIKNGNKLRKFFNSSERQRGKKECQEGLEDYQKHDIKELKNQIEMQMAHDCYMKENEAVRKGEPFNCTCSDPYRWGDEEVLRWHRLLKNDV